MTAVSGRASRRANAKTGEESPAGRIVALHRAPAITVALPCHREAGYSAADWRYRETRLTGHNTASLTGDTPNSMIVTHGRDTVSEYNYAPVVKRAAGFPVAGSCWPLLPVNPHFRSRHGSRGRWGPMQERAQWLHVEVTWDSVTATVTLTGEARPERLMLDLGALVFVDAAGGRALDRVVPPRRGPGVRVATSASPRAAPGARPARRTCGGTGQLRCRLLRD